MRVKVMGNLDYSDQGVSNFWEFLKITLRQIGWSQKDLIDKLEEVGHTIAPDKLSRAINSKRTRPEAAFLLALSKLHILKNEPSNEVYSAIDLTLICCGQLYPNGQDMTLTKHPPKTSSKTTLGDFLDDAINLLGDSLSAQESGLSIDRLKYLVWNPEILTPEESAGIADLLNRADSLSQVSDSKKIEKKEWNSGVVHSLYYQDVVRSGAQSANGSGLIAG